MRVVGVATRICSSAGVGLRVSINCGAGDQLRTVSDCFDFCNPSVLNQESRACAERDHRASVVMGAWRGDVTGMYRHDPMHVVDDVYRSSASRESTVI